MVDDGEKGEMAVEIVHGSLFFFFMNQQLVDHVHIEEYSQIAICSYLDCHHSQ